MILDACTMGIAAACTRNESLVLDWESLFLNKPKCVYAYISGILRGRSHYQVSSCWLMHGKFKRFQFYSMCGFVVSLMVLVCFAHNCLFFWSLCGFESYYYCWQFMVRRGYSWMLMPCLLPGKLQTCLVAKLLWLPSPNLQGSGKNLSFFRVCYCTWLCVRICNLRRCSCS